MYSPYLQSYIYRNRVGQAYSRNLQYSVDRTNRENCFLKHQLRDLMNENERLKTQIIQKNYKQIDRKYDYNLGYAKQISSLRNERIGKIYDSPKEEKRIRRFYEENPQRKESTIRYNSSADKREQKKFLHPQRYASYEKPKQKQTLIEQLNENRLSLNQNRNIKSVQSQYFYSNQRMNNYPYLLPQDRKKKNKKIQITKEEPNRPPQITQTKEISRKGSEKKGQKKHFLTLMNKTLQHSSQKKKEPLTIIKEHQSDKQE